MTYPACTERLGRTKDAQWGKRVLVTGQDQKGLTVHILYLERENVEGVMWGQVTSWICRLRCCDAVGEKSEGCFRKSPCLWLVTSGPKQENRGVRRKDCLGKDAQGSIRGMGVSGSISWRCFVTWVGYYQRGRWLLGFGQEPQTGLAWKCHQPLVTNFVCFQVPREGPCTNKNPRWKALAPVKTFLPWLRYTQKVCKCEKLLLTFGDHQQRLCSHKEMKHKPLVAYRHLIDQVSPTHCSYWLSQRGQEEDVSKTQV